MASIIFLLFVAVLFIDPKSLVAFAGKAGAMYGKLQNAKAELLGQLHSELGELDVPASATSNKSESAPSIRTQLKQWALAEPGPRESTSAEGLAARIEQLCAETSVDPAPATENTSIAPTQVANV